MADRQPDSKPNDPVRRHPLLLGVIVSLTQVIAWWCMASGSAAAMLAPVSAFSSAAFVTFSQRRDESSRLNPRPWLSAIYFGLGHAPAFGLAHWYIWQTAGLSLAPLLLYFCAFPAAIFYLIDKLRRRWPSLPLALTIPTLCVGLEVLRGEWLIGGYPWFLVGHTLTRPEGPPWLAQFVGVYGCSFVLIAAACLVNQAISRSSRTHFAGVACVIGAFAFWLLMPPLATRSPASSLRVSVIQTNLPQSNKLAWSVRDRVTVHQRWLDLSTQASKQLKPPALIVWPETMFPGPALNPDAVATQRQSGIAYALDGKNLPVTWFADTLLAEQGRSGVPWFVGALAVDGLRYTQQDGRILPASDERYNSAFLVQDGAVNQSRYDKVALMAFGEYIPVVYRWPAVQQWLVSLGAQGMAFDLSFGQQRTIFTVGNARLATPICFEICNEDHCRWLAFDGPTRRADLLVNLTNDGWFYASDFNRFMHRLQAQWRSAELRMPTLRAANTGISGAINDAGGLIPAQFEPTTAPGQLTHPAYSNARIEGILTVDIPLLSPDAPPSFYARYAKVLKAAFLLAGAALTVAAFWPKSSPRLISPPSPV